MGSVIIPLLSNHSIGVESAIRRRASRGYRPAGTDRRHHAGTISRPRRRPLMIDSHGLRSRSGTRRGADRRRLDLGLRLSRQALTIPCVCCNLDHPLADRPGPIRLSGVAHISAPVKRNRVLRAVNSLAGSTPRALIAGLVLRATAGLVVAACNADMMAGNAARCCPFSIFKRANTAQLASALRRHVARA
jgi:hypothetical protein